MMITSKTSPILCFLKYLEADLSIGQTAWGDSGVYICTVGSSQDLTGNGECYTELIVLGKCLPFHKQTHINGHPNISMCDFVTNTVQPQNRLFGFCHVWWVFTYSMWGIRAVFDDLLEIVGWRRSINGCPLLRVCDHFCVCVHLDG